MNFHHQELFPCVFSAPCAKLWMLFPSCVQIDQEITAQTVLNRSQSPRAHAVSAFSVHHCTYMCAQLSPSGAAWAAIRFAIRIGPTERETRGMGGILACGGAAVSLFRFNVSRWMHKHTCIICMRWAPILEPIWNIKCWAPWHCEEFLQVSQFNYQEMESERRAWIKYSTACGERRDFDGQFDENTRLECVYLVS